MAFQIEEQFEVATDPERVWEYLLDPSRVVECLPGATLVEAVDERTFRGRVKVSVGPVTVAYEGEAHFADIDQDARRVRIEAQGDEASGPGSARMTMTSTVEEADDGSARVSVHADVDVAGKIVQFGRGMIQTVSKQLFSEFSECVRGRLEGGSGSDEPESGGSGRADSADATADAHEGGDGDGDSAGSASAADGDQESSVALLPLIWRVVKGWAGRIFGR